MRNSIKTIKLNIRLMRLIFFSFFFLSKNGIFLRYKGTETDWQPHFLSSDVPVTTKDKNHRQACYPPPGECLLCISKVRWSSLFWSWVVAWAVMAQCHESEAAAAQHHFPAPASPPRHLLEPTTLQQNETFCVGPRRAGRAGGRRPTSFPITLYWIH